MKVSGLRLGAACTSPPGRHLFLSQNAHRCRCRRINAVAVVEGPPLEYDFRAEISTVSLEVVQRRYPQLVDLVRDGTLIVYQRPRDYKERRKDGYVEPEEVFIIGTAHISRKSAQDVERVIEAVQPQNVVVELCKGRTAILEDESSPPSSPLSTSAQQSSAGQSAPADDHTSTAAAPSTPGTNTSENGLEAAASTSSSQPGMALPTAQPVPQPLQFSADVGASTAAGPQQAGASGGAATTQEVANRKRANLLSLSGDNFWGSMLRSFQLGGQSAFVLRLLMASIAKRAAGA